MTKDKALKMALEALENIYDGFKMSPRAEYTTITVIKEALAQLEQEPQLTPSGTHKIGCVNHDCQHCKEMKDWEGIAADQAMTIALMKAEQLEQEPFKPDWDEKAVLVEEMQRVAKRIEELGQKVEKRSAEHLDAHLTYDKGYQAGRQDAEDHMRNTDWFRFVEQKHFKLGYDAGVLETQLDQAKERNFCPRCGKRLMSTLGPVSLHTCCPPSPTGWDNGLSQDYDKKLAAWFSEKPNAKEELRGRTFDDYGNKIT